MAISVKSVTNLGGALWADGKFGNSEHYNGFFLRSLQLFQNF
jgi:hypothetical protein